MLTIDLNKVDFSESQIKTYLKRRGFKIEYRAVPNQIITPSNIGSMKYDYYAIPKRETYDYKIHKTINETFYEIFNKKLSESIIKSMLKLIP